MTDSPPQTRSVVDVAAYYRELGFLYQWYGGSADGWHYGFYDDRIRSHESALVRCNEVLFDGISPESSPRVLDVGCGEGGLAVWAAARGFQVLGITIVPEHAACSVALAAEKGLMDRCVFAVMDLDSLALQDNAIDLVVNQETMCHSKGKSTYLTDVFRILRPGGLFRLVDFGLPPEPLTASGQASYRVVLDGFEISSLFSARELCRDLQRAGFRDVLVDDATSRIRRTAWLILLGSIGFHIAAKAGLDGLIYGRTEPKRSRYRRHVAACVAFNYGLLTGRFRYLAASATKPMMT